MISVRKSVKTTAHTAILVLYDKRTSVSEWGLRQVICRPDLWNKAQVTKSQTSPLLGTEPGPSSNKQSH